MLFKRLSFILQNKLNVKLFYDISIINDISINNFRSEKIYKLKFSKLLFKSIRFTIFIFHSKLKINNINNFVIDIIIIIIIADITDNFNINTYTVILIFNLLSINVIIR